MNERATFEFEVWVLWSRVWDDKRRRDEVDVKKHLIFTRGDDKAAYFDGDGYGPGCVAV